MVMEVCQTIIYAVECGYIKHRDMILKVIQASIVAYQWIFQGVLRYTTGYIHDNRLWFTWERCLGDLTDNYRDGVYNQLLVCGIFWQQQHFWNQFLTAKQHFGDEASVVDILVTIFNSLIVWLCYSKEWPFLGKILRLRLLYVFITSDFSSQGFRFFSLQNAHFC